MFGATVQGLARLNNLRWCRGISVVVRGWEFVPRLVQLASFTQP